MSRVFIIDPDFEHAGGHNFTANSIIASYVAGKVVVVGPVTLPRQVQIPGVSIRRILPCNSYTTTNTRGIFLDRLARVARAVFPGKLLRTDTVPATSFQTALGDFCAELDIDRNDSIVVHTGSEVLLAALLDVIDSLPEIRRPVVHYRQVRPVSDKQLAPLLHARLADLVRQNKAFIYSETEAFKETLVSLGHDELSIETMELADCSRPCKKQCAPDEFVTVSVLGTVRLEKGHRRLAGIARHYAQLATEFGGPQLRYLIHPAHIKNRKLFHQMLKSLHAVDAVFELAGTGAGEDIHWQTLADSHVVLMPYEGARYRDRGSGIAIDAIASARPLLISGDCTLEEYVRGGNGLTAVSDREFAQALLAIVRDYDSYSDNAMELALHFRATNSEHLFYGRLAGGRQTTVCRGNGLD